uniref:Uncharacterized protein n=1 Tax=viral metagenome TaxID=1070528 RepID=A0A6C0JW63_9ZZZZ
MWLVFAIIAILLAVAGIASYVYYRSNVQMVPYPNCNAGNYVWDIKFFPSATFANIHELIANLQSRSYATGPAYPIYIKQLVIGTVSTGKFMPSTDFANVTPGTYLLTPISSTNLCQSTRVTIEK